MTTLAAAVNATQGFCANTDSIESFPRGWYELDAELVYVGDYVEGWLNGTYQPIGRRLGRRQNSTTAASHAEGTTFTPAAAPTVATPADPFDGTADPSTGAGRAGDVGESYLQGLPQGRNPSGSKDPRILGQYWLKTGDGDTDWVLTAREPLELGHREW
jgi:hypothetical protein